VVPVEAERAVPLGRSYQLEPLDTSGVFLGLGLIQCCLLGSGITTAVLAFTAGLWLPIAVAPLIGAMVVSFAQVSGSPAWEWLPAGIAWLWGRVRRGRRWTAPLPLLPMDGSTSAPLPPCLAGLDIIELAWRGTQRLGIVRDHERATFTALVPAQIAQFGAESRADQERLLAGWGDVLSQFAVDRGLVTHLFWSDLAHSSGLQGHRTWLDGGGRLAGDAAAVSSYRELVDQAAIDAVVHDVVLGITVARDRLKAHRRGAGGADDLLAQGLVTAIEALLRGLRSAAVTAGEPLEALGLHRLLRARIDPVSTAPAAQRWSGRLVDRLGLVTPASSGPLVVEPSWRHVRVDGAWHRTWWVACWPRLAVPPWWLEPFVSAGGAARTMTVTLMPVPAHQSRRRIERDLVKLSSDAAAMEDKGRRVDAGHQRATESLLDREAELVAGYAEMAYVGLVCLSAGSEDELEEQSEITEQLAREAGMELRALDGRQDLAWAAALPLGLAPRALVGT
jgi:hypothetical protein